jgi:lysophospholipase L1-like esterase
MCRFVVCLVAAALTWAAAVNARAAEAPTTAPVATPAPELNALAQMHYQNRVRSFKEQNQVYRNVVLLGDSITEGFELDKYLPGRRVLNRGIGSDVIGNDLPPNDKRGVLKRLDESVFDCAATDVFILIGINDLGQGHTPEMVERGYREMLSQIRASRPQLKLHVQSVLPTRDRYAKHNAAIEDVNARLKKLAAEFHCDYIDLHSLMADEKGELKPEFTQEGLHLVDPAYRVWAKVVEEKMGWRTQP